MFSPKLSNNHGQDFIQGNFNCFMLAVTVFSTTIPKFMFQRAFHFAQTSGEVQVKCRVKRQPPWKVEFIFRNFSSWTEPIHSNSNQNFRGFLLNRLCPWFRYLTKNHSWRKHHKQISYIFTVEKEVNKQTANFWEDFSLRVWYVDSTETLTTRLVERQKATDKPAKEWSTDKLCSF